MDIKQCRDCNDVFLSGGSNYCESCDKSFDNFQQLVEEKIEMLKLAIERRLAADWEDGKWTL